MAVSSTSPSPPLYVAIYCKGVKTSAALQPGGGFRCVRCGRRVKVAW